MDLRDPNAILAENNLRITRPRALVAKLLFGDGVDRHVSAEWVAEQLEQSGDGVALASVYNTLHHFVDAGLLRQLHGAERGVTIFDTNTSPHHHIYNERTGELTDIPHGALKISGAPDLADDEVVVGCDVIIRVR